MTIKLQDRLSIAATMARTLWSDRGLDAYLLKQLPYYDSDQYKAPSNGLHIDKRLESYLSVALEANLSILVCSPIPHLRSALLDIIVSTIPQGCATAIVSKDLGSVHSGGISFCSRYVYGRSAQLIRPCIDKALQSHPDWLVVDEITAPGSASVFSALSFGSSYISALRFDTGGAPLIAKLSSQLLHKDPARISSIDVSVTARSYGEIKIHEYSWLSRGEIGEGIELAGRDMFQSREICSIPSGCLQASKAMAKYAWIYGMPDIWDAGKISNAPKLPV